VGRTFCVWGVGAQRVHGPNRRLYSCSRSPSGAHARVRPTRTVLIFGYRHTDGNTDAATGAATDADTATDAATDADTDTDVYARRGAGNRIRARPLSYFSINVYVERGAGERDVGVRRRVSDKRPRQQTLPIGASSEGRLAWPLLAVLPATFARRPVR